MMALPGNTPARRLRNILSLQDFETAARRHLPRPIFGFIAGAAEDRRAFDGMRAAFDTWALQPRVLVDVSQRTQAIELFGERYASPFGIAPMGISALSAYRGDLVQARAAQKAGIPMILSGTSLIRLEEVVAEAPSTWFQAYLPGVIGRLDALVDRVARAGYRTLVVTADVPVAGNRENNVRSGFSTPLRPGLRLAWDGAIRPRWLLGTFARTLLRHGMPHFENSFAERGAPILSARAVREFSARDHLSWRHFEHVRGRWSGNLVVKGVLHPQDAERARDAGADGLIVSSHGGRQLDHAVAPLQVLPGIVAAAGPQMTVMLDGGVRRGTDVVKALALGARAVFVGRPFNFAASVAGEAGVSHAIDLLRDEVDRDMALLGAQAVSNLGRSTLTRAMTIC